MAQNESSVYRENNLRMNTPEKSDRFQTSCALCYDILFAYVSELSFKCCNYLFLTLFRTDSAHDLDMTVTDGRTKRPTGTPYYTEMRERIEKQMHSRQEDGAMHYGPELEKHRINSHPINHCPTSERCERMAQYFSLNSCVFWPTVRWNLPRRGF